MDGKEKGKMTEDGKGMQRGRGRETVKGKVLLDKHLWEMISLVPLRCRCRRKCIRQT
jgi:hypothetical protein